MKQKVKLNLKLKKLQGLQAVETRKLPLIETQKEEAKIEGLKVVETRKFTNLWDLEEKFNWRQDKLRVKLK